MEILTGTILFRSYAKGSKSESVRPFLYIDDGKEIAIFKADDNPFENKGFTEYEGKNVILHGKMNGNTFVATEIKEIKE